MFEVTRRDLIVSSAVAAAMFGLNGRMAFLGVANAQKATDQGFLRYRVGSIEVTAVSDGLWEKAHDPAYIQNATVEQTKAALAAGGLPTDFVPVPFTPYLVKVGGELVLVDSGTGGGQTGGPKAGVFMKNLAAAGVDAGEIKTILITHFHPDHVSGLMSKAPENKPVFPNAVIHVAASEYRFWMDPAVIEKLPEARRPLAKRLQEMFPLMKGQVSQFSGDKEVLPGIRPMEAQGHTPGHVAYHVSSGKDQLLLVGDSINIPALFVKNPGWHGVFDQDAVKAEATRRMLLERAVAEKITIAGFHFPFPAVGTIGKDGPGYAYLPM